MKNTKVTLIPLTVDDREQFILDNQWAFKYGAMQEFANVIITLMMTVKLYHERPLNALLITRKMKPTAFRCFFRCADSQYRTLSLCL